LDALIAPRTDANEEIELKLLAAAGACRCASDAGSGICRTGPDAAAPQGPQAGHDTTTTQKFLRDLAHQLVTPEINWTIGVVMGWQARDRI
jgi:hypothetical protein